MPTTDQMLETLCQSVRPHLVDQWFMVGDVSAERGSRVYQLTYEMAVGLTHAEGGLIVRFEPYLSTDWTDTRVFYRRLPVDIAVSVLRTSAYFGIPDLDAAREMNLSDAAESGLRQAFMASVYIPITFHTTRSFADREMRYTLRIKISPSITLELTITQDDDSVLHTSAKSNLVWMMLHQMFSEALAQATAHLFPNGLNTWANRLTPILTAAAEGREYGRPIPPGHPIPPADGAQQTVLLVPSFLQNNLDALGCEEGRQLLRFYRPRSRKQWEQGKFGIDEEEHATIERTDPFRRPPRKMML